MTVDVQSAVVIERPREEVAAFAADPDNTVRWYANIRSVHWRTARPARVGSQFAFVARFLGRTLAYTYEVRELVPGELLVMSTADGPFPMETTYRWVDAGQDRTRMTLRNRGEPGALPDTGDVTGGAHPLLARPVLSWRRRITTV